MSDLITATVFGISTLIALLCLPSLWVLRPEFIQAQRLDADYFHSRNRTGALRRALSTAARKAEAAAIKVRYKLR
jgi:hypothetical protein